MNPLDKLEIKLITEILKRQSKTEYTLDVDSNKYRCSTCTRAFSRLKIMTNHCYICPLKIKIREMKSLVAVYNISYRYAINTNQILTEQMILWFESEYSDIYQTFYENFMKEDDWLNIKRNEIALLLTNIKTNLTAKDRKRYRNLVHCYHLDLL